MKLPASRIVLLAFLISGSSSLYAQKDQAPEMRRLAQSLVGAWSITETDEPDPQMPNDETYHGREVWSQPGGGPVMEQFHSKPSTGDQYETALFWWDTKAQAFRGLWCAPINDEGCNGFKAKWDGNQLVLDGEWEYHGNRRTWREVFIFPTPTSFIQKLYLGFLGDDPKLSATIHGTKITPGKKP